MALRQALRNLGGGAARGMATVAHPTGPVWVSSKMINLTVVLEGQRFPVKGKIGKNLAEVISQSGIADLVAACPSISLGKGPDTHVRLPPSIIAMLPELSLEQKSYIGDLCENPSAISRMASMVTLLPEMDGSAVAIEANRPFRTP
eukprot:CAMPEP_0197585312 /NCGR_PEP_ID=MMETSP1326-20131121/7648_1 /TAXON_ID=1155430 /ORGANISM="Genus nov. species nov., Strain RCC2288" /LENGTH=145 /DNA_ID=CAMNT_0043149793 /DNA_START=39 /DNA_END=476 /DNA_ORIENTATION=-